MHTTNSPDLGKIPWQWQRWQISLKFYKRSHEHFQCFFRITYALHVVLKFQEFLSSVLCFALVLDDQFH